MLSLQIEELFPFGLYDGSAYPREENPLEVDVSADRRLRKRSFAICPALADGSGTLTQPALRLLSAILAETADGLGISKYAAVGAWSQ